MPSEVEEVCLKTHMEMVTVKPLRPMALHELHLLMDDALLEVVD